MMNFCKRILLLFVLVILTGEVFAQDKKVEMADTMRSNGRIYVVVAVVITILLGLILYVTRLDRKMTRLEKENRL
ncbi:MAG: CcmD family protein [Chitinophagaceae bacterium]